MPAIRWSLELDSSNYQKGVEDAKKALDDAKAHAQKIQQDLQTLDDQRAISAKNITQSQIQNYMRLAQTYEGADFAKLQTKATSQVIALEAKHTAAVAAQSKNRIAIALREATATAALRRRAGIVGATQIASAAGVRIPGGVTGLALGGGAALGIGAAVAGVAAAKSAVQSTSAWITSMAELSRQSGSTTEEVSKLAIATEKFGGNAAALGPALSTLRGATQTNAQAFADLGIALKNADGSARPILDVFADVRAKLADATSEADRDALAQQLLGGSWRELIGILNLSPAAFDAATEAAAKSARVVGKDAVQANQEYIRTLREMDLALADVSQTFGGTLAKAITSFIQNTGREFDTLGTFLTLNGRDGRNVFEAFGEAASQAQKRMEQRREDARRQTDRTPGGTNLAGALDKSVDPAIAAFRSLSSEGQRAFSAISGSASRAGSEISATLDGALDDVQARFKVLFDAGQITSDQQAATKLAISLGLSPAQIASIFDVATGMVGLGMEGLKAKVQAQGFDALSELMKKITLGNVEQELQGVDERIASIDESLLRMTEKADKATADADRKIADVDSQFDESETARALRAREEERVFLPNRPRADAEAEEKEKGGLTAADQREIKRLQNERALLAAKRETLATDLDARRAQAAKAQAEIDAAKAAVEAAAAEKKADDEKIARYTTIVNKLHEVKNLRAEMAADAAAAAAAEVEHKAWLNERDKVLGGRDRPAGSTGNVAPQDAGERARDTRRITVDVTSSDGTLKGASIEMVRQVAIEVFGEIASDTATRVRQGVRTSGGGGGAHIAP